ncbi:MAG TPA: cytochrome P460 family protein, partial [Candidatus Angelobacter sp.]|nr:cytochrome P460 family protein [Candidatus Angelobacter sp.]
MNRTIAISSAAILSVFTAVLWVGTQNGAGQQSVPSRPQSTATPGKYVDKEGTIRLPEGYRLDWTHLGSWYVEDKKDGSGSLHDVYAEPEAVVTFRNTGKWPHGATIVKEVRASRKGKMTTGNAHWDGQIIQ